MQYKEVKSDSNFLEIEISKLKSGEGATLGNFLRRYTVMLDVGYKVIGIKLKVGGVEVKDPFTALPGVEDEVISIFMSSQQLKFANVKDDDNISKDFGKLIKFVYSGNSNRITAKDLISSDDKIKIIPALNSVSLINNIGKSDIYLELLVCFNEGFVKKDINSLIIAENNLMSHEYLVFDTTHTNIEKVNFTVAELSSEEKLCFELKTTYGDPKKVLRNILNKIHESTSILMQNLQ